MKNGHSSVSPCVRSEGVCPIEPKPILLLLPGMICNHRVWAAQAEALSDLVEPCVAVYGPERSVTEMAVAVLRQSPQRFLLAGHSMGGRVAMEMLRLAPERVRGLCLMGTECKPCPAGQQGMQELASRHQLLQIAYADGMPAMAQAWLPRLIAASRLPDRSLANEILQMIADHSPEQLEAHIEAGASRPDSSTQLSSIRVPTLVLAGAEDALRPVAAHREMAALIPDCQLQIISDCGHMLPMEQPCVVNAAMRNWIVRSLAEADAHVTHHDDHQPVHVG
ncbi:alpha/beta fold hydrolase [Stutzerimonas stutzeri]|nr:alpha/beta hydrolase [Stutzerimonas stutzeri]